LLLVVVLVCSEFAQFKRDQSVAADNHRFALENAHKEKEDAERQRDEYKLRFGAVWPQPLLSTSHIGLAHTHPGAHAHSHAPALSPSFHPHVDPDSGGHASPPGAAGHIDVAAGARAVQAQLASVRMRAAGSSE